jgi:heme-degrading monooxygenase HmoA
MISRQWRGISKREFAGAYVEHLRSETFPAIRKLPGFVRSSILQRAVPEGVEFLIVTQWVSLESIRGFAGAHAETAVVPEKVRAMMVEFDPVVRHYEIID